MGNQGVAIGAALAGNIVLSAKPNLQVSLPKQFTTMALGPEYSDRDIDSALESAPGRLAVYRVRDSHRLAGMIAKALTDGKIVARLNGRMEFGPRALGNRSILAPATSTIYADRLNNALQRDDFMPFAPMTLEAHADSSFNLYHKATGCAAFMTTSLSTSSAFGQNYPAVNHVDGTARPQVVGRAQSDALDILSKYQELTGLNTIINTSFNMHGEPIVESPQGAIATFLASGIDHLAAGSYFISRESDAKADA